MLFSPFIDNVYLNTGVSAGLSEVVSDAVYQASLPSHRTTPLCLLMRKQGSDKAPGPHHVWHNYSLFYHSLFSSTRENVKTLLEVGIGTNNLDIPSSMGVAGIPGASLRAWASYFTSATIYGADVDQSILFEEDQIKTFFIDQLSLDIIQSATAGFSPGFFNVIIDDGLHTLEANRNLYAGINHLVTAGGYYIIEDINCNSENVSNFIKHLADIGRPTILFRLPHVVNKSDNCMAIIEF